MLAEDILAKALQEESTLVLKRIRRNHVNAIDFGCFNLDLHSGYEPREIRAEAKPRQ